MSTEANAQADAADAGSEQAPEADVYDKAFDQFLAPDAPGADQSSDDAQDQAGEAAQQQQTQQAEDYPTQAPELTEQQTELLQRSHLTPEMVAGWTTQQRDEFFSNAAKREADQASFSRSKGDEVADLKRRLDELEKGKGKDQIDDNAGTTDAGTPDAAKLGETFKTVLTDLSDTYGDEFKALEAPIMGIVEQAEQLSGQLAQTEQALNVQNRVIVDMVIDKGIGDLATEYPALSEEATRSDVEAEFVKLWKADDSPYRTGQGPLLQRVKQGIKAAADSKLGTKTKTQAAAQAALLDKTKQQLANQPGDGQGRTQKKPLTEDQMYDQAFEETIGKK